MKAVSLVSQSIPLEAECCLCPAIARQNRILRGSMLKTKFCDDCFTLSKTLGTAELSKRKLRALRGKKVVRGLCARYRCTEQPVTGKTCCSKCNESQKNFMIKYRSKRLAQGKTLQNNPRNPSKVVESIQSVVYRRITIESLLC